MGFAALTDNGDFAGDDFASDGFLADFDIEILHSVDDGVAPHHRSPASAIKPAGQDPASALGAQVCNSTAPIRAECQSFLRAVSDLFRVLADGASNSSRMCLQSTEAKWCLDEFPAKKTRTPEHSEVD